METKTKRNGFSSAIGFILAAAGSAIGLGNLWAFPYKTSIYGGAAFVFIYILSVLVIGIIAMIAEVYLGKRSQANPVTSYQKANNKMGWLGLFAIIIPAVITCYYSVLGGYTVRYAFNSFGTNAGTVSSFTGNFPLVITCSAIFIGLALLVIIGGVQQGIEKASKVLMPTLFVILVALVIYCLCLGEGVKEGLEYYLKPDFSKVTFKTVLAAMSQAFYSLSLGMGIMVSYGSYANKDLNIIKCTASVCVFDTLVALLAGLTIFPAIYHYKAVSGNSAVSEKGLMLMFDTLPLVFEDLGLFGKFISFFFFAMVIIAALTSVISLLEVVTQFVIQKFKVKRKIAISIVALICFVVSIPISMSLGYLLNGQDKMLAFGQDLLDFLDIITNTVLMPVCAFGSVFTIGWLLGKKESVSDWFSIKFLRDTLEADGLHLGWFGLPFAVFVKYITPLLIAVIEVFGVKDMIVVDGKLDSNGLWITIISYLVLAASIVVYKLFLQGKNNGVNADELK